MKKYRLYFNYAACVTREVEVENESELEETINELRNEIPEIEIADSIIEDSVDYEEVN